VEVGRWSWSIVGILLVVLAAGVVASRLSLVVVPLVLALFPAAVLAPVSGRLVRVGVPAALAALAVILGVLGVVVAAGVFLVPALLAQAQPLADAVSRGVELVEERLPALPVGPDVSTVPDLLRALGAEAAAGGSVVDRTIGAATRTVEVVVATLLLVVALFFYLKDGRRIVSALLGFVPASVRPHVDEVARRVWWTVGRYFQGQLLVALVDAVLIGLGLWALGVPLVAPLAVLVFLGGFFPVVGAFVSGLVAVLVAVADGGPAAGLATLAVVVGVQQLESNVLAPILFSRIIRLHPLTVLVSLTVGGLTLGILGAFLAVPVAAGVARGVEYTRERRTAARPPDPPDPPEAPEPDGPQPGGSEGSSSVVSPGDTPSSRRVPDHRGAPER
jgi:putative heme transporter